MSYLGEAGRHASIDTLGTPTQEYPSCVRMLVLLLFFPSRSLPS